MFPPTLAHGVAQVERAGGPVAVVEVAHTPPACHLSPDGTRTSAIAWLAAPPEPVPGPPPPDALPVTVKKDSETAFRVGEDLVYAAPVMLGAGGIGFAAALSCNCGEGGNCSDLPAWCYSSAPSIIGISSLGLITSAPFVAGVGSGIAAGAVHRSVAPAIPVAAAGMWPGALALAVPVGEDGSLGGVLASILLGLGGYVGSGAFAMYEADLSRRAHERHAAAVAAAGAPPAGDSGGENSVFWPASGTGLDPLVLDSSPDGSGVWGEWSGTGSLVPGVDANHYATDPDYADPLGLVNGFPNLRLTGSVGKDTCTVASGEIDLDGVPRPTPSTDAKAEPGAFEVQAP